MAYIGKVTLSTDWEKLEDLIKAQVDGQSAFAFDTSKTYIIQADTARGPYISGANLCNSATEPAEIDDGEHMAQEQVGVYQPESGVDLWVKASTVNVVKLSISE